MSDIPRYRPVANDRYGITDDADGKLCEYRDYARLKAEVERLRASSFVTAVPVEEYDKLKADFHQAHDERADYAKDVSKLKAEVERLQHLANQSEFYRSQLQKDTCRLENIQFQDAFKHYEAENARLKAEVERLTLLIESNLNSSKVAMGKADAVLYERDSLKAENARLRNAGDAMRWLIECQNDDAYYGHNEEHAEAVKAWNAAKEGKQP